MDNPAGRGRVLLSVAAPREAAAVVRGLDAESRPTEPWRIHRLDDRFDLVLTGVGKANAAGAVGWALDPSVHRAVVNLGVAGALPWAGLELCDVALATSSVFGDEGMVTPAGYQNIASMGFAPAPNGGMAVEATPWLAALLGPLCDATGPIATVSLCSATDAGAEAIVSRTGAIAETMEGAAVGLATAWRGTAARANVHAKIAGAATIAFAELRVISNTTGERDRQRWALDEALDRLTTLTASISCLYWDQPRSA